MPTIPAVLSEWVATDVKGEFIDTKSRKWRVETTSGGLTRIVVEKRRTGRVATPHTLPLAMSEE